MWNGMAPNDIEWWVYLNGAWKDIINTGSMHSTDIPSADYDVWRCPECERAYAFPYNDNDTRDCNKVVKYYVLYSHAELKNFQYDFVSEDKSMVCECGNKLSEDQEDVRLVVYSDREWEDKVNLGDIDSAKIPPPSLDLWCCSKCERAYVFEGDELIKYYVLHGLDELTSG